MLKLNPLGSIAPKVTLLTAYSIMVSLFEMPSVIAGRFHSLRETVVKRVGSNPEHQCLDRDCLIAGGTVQVCGQVTLLYAHLKQCSHCELLQTTSPTTKQNSGSQSDNRNGLPTIHSKPVAHSYTQ